MDNSLDTADADDRQLERLGYKPEMLREFTSFGTFSFAFSVTGILAGAMATFHMPLLAGGPASVVWTWFWGSFGCACLGFSVAELISAYPTDGGCYYVVRHVVPSTWVPSVGWAVGWATLLGQIACSASVDFAMASQCTALACMVSDYTYKAPNSHTVSVMIVCLLFHGSLNSLPTRWLARITSWYTVINMGGIFAAIISLLIMCETKNSASYVFTHFENHSGWSNDGLGFTLGLLAVAWTMTDYDGVSHITEETSKANVRAPVAVIAAVVLTAVLGWVLFIVLVLCMGTDIETLLHAPSGLPVALIYYNNLGKAGAIAMMIITIMVQNFTCAVCMQACSRTIYATARDGLIPFSRVFAKVHPRTKTPLAAVWLICAIAAVLGLLDLASYYAATTIFAVTSIALDWSYVVPVVCKVLFADSTSYVRGPVHFGRASKWLSLVSLVWVSYVSIILCLPLEFPVTKDSMNYAPVVLAGWLLLSYIYWLVNAARGKRYLGPGANVAMVNGRKE